MAIIWNNVRNAPQRWAAKWLKRRGWVCFYLDQEYRTCNGGTCWLRLYQDGERREQR